MIITLVLITQMRVTRAEHSILMTYKCVNRIYISNNINHIYSLTAKPFLESCSCGVCMFTLKLNKDQD